MRISEQERTMYREAWSNIREKHMPRPVIDALVAHYCCCIRTGYYNHYAAFPTMQVWLCTNFYGEEKQEEIELPTVETFQEKNLFHDWTVGQWLEAISQIIPWYKDPQDRWLVPFLQEEVRRMNNEKWD